MRTVYAWHKEDANIAKLQANRIERVWFAANDATLVQIRHARTNGFEAGIYTNPQWYGYPEAKDFRDLIQNAIRRLSDGQPLPVQINNERHDPLYMMAIMFWYRRMYQVRGTSWNFEGYQGGWVGPMFRTTYSYTHSLVGTVQISPAVLANLELIPQAYDGSMNPYDPHDVVKDLVDWGCPYQAINPIVGGEYAPWTARRANQHFYLQSRLP
jgi:hypothetical protein